MPKFGDIRVGKNWIKEIYYGCIDCNALRWVPLIKGKPKTKRCRKCNAEYNKKFLNHKHGKESANWKNGWIRNGYKYITISPDDPYISMCKANNAILEHRYVMAKHLGRCLESYEIVHHKNHNKLDNRIENLSLFIQSEHLVDIMITKENNKLKHRIKYLEGILDRENICY